MQKNGKGWTRPGTVAVLVALVAGLLLGSLDRQPAAVHAQERKQPAGHFLSGSERSERVLREIAETLKRIDQRVGRIEVRLEALAKSDRTARTPR